MKTLKFFSAISLILILFTFSCKKKKGDPHIPPDVIFKSGGIYTNEDRTISKKDTIMVGIIATKTEDDLKSYNVSYYYDSGTTSTTFFNYFLTSSEINSYSHDIKIGARDQSGTEKWVFSVVDRDGNITQKTIILTVN